MDIKGKINEIVEKVKEDPKMLKKFQDDPVAVIEDLIGVDLPDDMVEKVVDGVKAKIAADKISGALGSLKKLF